MDEDWDLDSDWEGHDEDWSDEAYDGPAATIRCEHCGHEIYADAVACPICGHFAVNGPSRLAAKPTWYLALGAAGILAVIVGLLGIISCL